MLVEEYLQVCLVFVLSYAALAALALYSAPCAATEEASPIAPANAVFMRVRMCGPGRAAALRRV
jgi:hypothetical protein